MDLLSPKPTTSDISEATASKFPAKTPVEAGTYEMVIQNEPFVLTSKAGNKYLQLMLTHTGDVKNAPAVYPNFNLNEIGQAQFSQLLLALGISAGDVAQAQWGTRSDEADEKGRQAGVIAINGDELQVAGRTVSVYLTNKEETFNGKTSIKNKVSRFIVAK